MDKRAIIILIFFLVIIGIILIGKQQEQDLQLRQVEQTATQELKNLAAQAQQVKTAAIQEAQKAKEEAMKAEQMALERAKQAEAEALKAKQAAEAAAQKASEEVKAKVSQLIAEAQALLDGGQFQAAIDMAKQVLADDPNNLDAQSIIEKATAKLKEAASQGVQNLMDAAQQAIPAGTAPAE
jgi:colicin import membrane protein